MINDSLSPWNPLMGLDLPGAIARLNLGEQGFYRDLMWTYRYILKRNGVARAVRKKVAGSLGKLDWNIKIPDKLEGDRLKLAEAQQAKLREAYDLIDNLNAAIVHLGFAEIMGYAHVNKVYAGEGEPDPWAVTELRVVEQWYLRRRGLFGPWLYDPEARPTNTGTPIDPAHWIFREVPDPAAEIFLLLHLKMAETDDDWREFCQTYAVPPTFVEMPANVRKEDEPEYQRMAEGIVSDGRGSHPNGAKVYNLEAANGSTNVFTERLRFLREEAVLAGTGGMLSILDGETGLGKGASDNHDATWLDIAASIGAEITALFNRNFDEPTLERLFPNQEQLAYFDLDRPKESPKAGDVFLEAKTASEAGLALDPDEVSEKSGWTVTLASAPAAGSPNTPTEKTAALPGAAAAPGTPGTEQPPEVKTPPAASPGRAAVVPDPAKESPQASAAGEAKPSLVEAALANDLDVERRWLAPVGDLFGEIERMLTDPAVPLDAVAAKMEQAKKILPDLLGSLNVDELARALENAAGPAAVEGLFDGLRAKTTKTAG